MSVAYLLHTFDVLDVGDIDLVRQVSDLAAHVVVGVLDDHQVEILTGRPPIIPLVERATLVGHLRGVDATVVHGVDPVPPDAVVYVERGLAASWDGVCVELDARSRTTSALLLAGNRRLASHLGEDVA